MISRARVGQAIHDHPVDWLIMLLVSWLIPLGLLRDWGVKYIWSLLLWAVPIVTLLPRFFSRTRSEPIVRRAFCWTVLYIFVGGCVLDLIFGFLILCFDCDPSAYVCRVPAVITRIPIEELLFYILGALAVMLIYFWADRFWLGQYHVNEQRLDDVPGPLLQFSSTALLIALGVFVAGVMLKRFYTSHWGIPTYFTFLDVVAFAPALAIYRRVKQHVNWQAFSFTALYVILTACVWEVTLALPRRWWGYQRDAMLGLLIYPWTRDPIKPPACAMPSTDTFGEYPIEALLVWLVVSFAAVLTFEAIRIYHHSAGTARERLLGPSMAAKG